MKIELYCLNCERMTDCDIELEITRSQKIDGVAPCVQVDVEAEAVCTQCNHGVDIDRETFTFSVR